MTDANAPIPAPVIKPPGGLRFSLIWLVPLIAALVGLSLIARSYLQAGPTIQIHFETAEGLENGKTEVRYKDVVVGKVKTIALSEDDSGVVVTVDLEKSATRLAVDDTRFWVVRPRIGASGVSGISTLLSGAYIGVDAGQSADARRAFTGLEKPPAVTHDRKGRRYTLHAADAGSITIGAPVYYRRVPVGRVVDASFDGDGRRITMQIFVDAPYDHFVSANARFWNAGGVDLALSSSGLKLNTQSLATVLAGGIAFQSPDDTQDGDAAPENAEFTLFADQAAALAPADGPAVEAVLVFPQSTRGLNPGTSVDFLGVRIGTVKAVDPQYDTVRRRFYSRVRLELFFERLGPAYKTLAAQEKTSPSMSRQILQRFVEQGLQAQLRLGNLITGQVYVALFFKPGAARHSAAATDGVVEIPTTAGSLEEIQLQIENIVRKLNDVPFDEIGRKLGTTLDATHTLIDQLNNELAPDARKLLRDASTTIRALEQNLASPDAPIQQDTRSTLEQINRAAASLRVLSDYLEQHPESLLRGKGATAEPPADAGRH